MVRGGGVEGRGLREDGDGVVVIYDLFGWADFCPPSLPSVPPSTSGSTTPGLFGTLWRPLRFLPPPWYRKGWTGWGVVAPAAAAARVA